eukprot:SM000008S22312  [mRNA]  locus=s8:1027925:1030195:+ [translate_table: standard]
MPAVAARMALLAAHQLAGSVDAAAGALLLLAVASTVTGGAVLLTLATALLLIYHRQSGAPSPSSPPPQILKAAVVVVRPLAVALLPAAPPAAAPPVAAPALEKAGSDDAEAAIAATSSSPAEAPGPQPEQAEAETAAAAADPLLELKARGLLRLRRYGDVLALLAAYRLDGPGSAVAAVTAEPAPDAAGAAAGPASAWPHVVLGQAFFHLGRLPEALQHLRPAKRVFGSLARVLSESSGDDGFETFESAEAVGSYGTWTDRDLGCQLLATTKLLVRRIAAGDAARDAGFPAEAARHYSMLLDGRKGASQPVVVDLYMRRAACYRALGRPAAAIADCSRAAALDAAHGGALCARAALWESLGAYGEASRSLEAVAALCRQRCGGVEGGMARSRSSPVGASMCKYNMALPDGAVSDDDDAAVARSLLLHHSSLPPRLHKSESQWAVAAAAAAAMSAEDVAAWEPEVPAAGEVSRHVWAAALSRVEAKLAWLDRRRLHSAAPAVDPRALLGLAPSCSAADAERAFRVTALHAHPERAAIMPLSRGAAATADERELRARGRAEAVRLFRILTTAAKGLLNTLEEQEEAELDAAEAAATATVAGGAVLGCASAKVSHEAMAPAATVRRHDNHCRWERH